MPYDPACPACREKRYHTEAEWKLHPGEGREGKDYECPPVKEKSETDNREHHEDREVGRNAG